VVVARRTFSLSGTGVVVFVGDVGAVHPANRIVIRMMAIMVKRRALFGDVFIGLTSFIYHATTNEDFYLL